MTDSETLAAIYRKVTNTELRIEHIDTLLATHIQRDDDRFEGLHEGQRRIDSALNQIQQLQAAEVRTELTEMRKDRKTTANRKRTRRWSLAVGVITAVISAIIGGVSTWILAL